MVAIFSISRYILAHALPHSAGGHGDWQRLRRWTIYICDIILFSSSRSQRRPGILQRRRRRRITSHRRWRQRSHAICHHESRSRSTVPSSVGATIETRHVSGESQMDIIKTEREEWERDADVLRFFFVTLYDFLFYVLIKQVDGIMFGVLHYSDSRSPHSSQYSHNNIIVIVVFMVYYYCFPISLKHINFFISYHYVPSRPYHVPPVDDRIASSSSLLITDCLRQRVNSWSARE